MRGRCAALTASQAFSMSAFGCARQTADNRRFAQRPPLGDHRADLFGDAPHREQIVGRRRRKPGLENINSQAREGARHFDFFIRGKGCAGRLFAIA